MDRYLCPSRTAPSTQMSLLSFAPRFTCTNHAPAKRPAPVPAMRGPCRPRKRPRPVDVDDRFVHIWYASIEKEIQEVVNVTESYSDTLSFFPASLRVPTKFQASHTAERRFEVHEYYTSVLR